MPNNNEKNNDFLRSLSSLTSDEIRVKKKKKHHILDMVLDNARFLILGICIAVFGVCMCFIGKTIIDYNEQNKLYDAVGNFVMNNEGVEMMFPEFDAPVTPDHKTGLTLSQDDLSDYTNVQVVNKEYAKVRVKLLNLKARYPDLYGWITVSGTNINYPIMQAKDNDYYLNHSYNGTMLGAGAIFADFTCEPRLLSNKNLVIYGHHMSNSSMFNQLDNFLKESFFMNNGKITVYTLDGMYTYEIYSIYDTNKLDPYITTYFSSNDIFVDFAERSEAKSIYRKEDILFTHKSKLLTLSTCNNRFEGGRIAVHAVLVDIYANPNS